MEGQLMAFDCPNCGETNHLRGDPADFESRVFACEGCDENVLLENYRGERR